MNTEKFVSSALEYDNVSQGFSSQETANLLLKKFFWRANTGFTTSHINEPLYTPNIYPEQVVSDAVPQQPPTDFVQLSNDEISADFGIGLDEIAQFQTTKNGSGSFSIEKSTAHPHIYKINHCLLRPWPSNPSLTFTAITARTKVNLLQNSIPFAFGAGSWRGQFHRTTPSGELSRAGTDTIKETQFAFIFDSDSGFFTCYEKDCYKLSPNTIGSNNPPAVSCYVYRGTFGNLSPWRYVGNTGNIYYSGGQVLIGKTTTSDPTLSLDVSGVGSIDNIVTTSLETFSDKRLKENIVPYRSTHNVLKLDTYQYNYIANPESIEFGLIAQEVEEVCPLIVKEHKGFKAVQYDRIGVLLLPVVKEQDEKIKMLEGELAKHKGYAKRVEQMEAELDALRGQFSSLVHKLF